MKQSPREVGEHPEKSDVQAQDGCGPQECEVGGTWPNETDTKLGAHPTGRTGPIDDVNRDEYDEPGENAAANEPEAIPKH